VRLVQLARLLNSPSNVIVADDPLRGLSLAQIRGLEEVLLAYDGVLLLRNCHDLVFLDRVASHVLSYEYRGREGDRLFLSEGGYFQARQAAKRRQKQFEKEWNEQQRRDSVYRSGHHLLDLPFKFKI
jgi:ATPase subunit of ABC transporter with duplicated ATPase domains